MEKQQLEPIPSRKSETPMSWGSTCRTFPSSVSGLSGMGIQAQLETTAPGDIYEQEADRMADYVVGVSSKPESPVSGMSRPSVSAFGGTSVALPSSLGSRIGEVRGRGWRCLERAVEDGRLVVQVPRRPGLRGRRKEDRKLQHVSAWDNVLR